jgi:glycolate oxidase FAD binding subunit
VPLEGGENATLGGTIATDHFGGAKLKYGAPRDLVTGLHVALSDGRLVKAGGKVVKNVSGYDLNKLFIGSFGALGLITEVTIRLRPVPEVSREWRNAAPSWDDAAQLATDILNGAYEPTFLRVIWDENGATVSSEFEGGEAAVKAQLDRLPQDGNDIEMREPHGAWLLRAHLPLKTAASWAQYARQVGATSVLWETGLGIVRAAFEGAPDVNALRAQAEGAGGFLIVENAPVEAKNPDFVWGAPRADFALMKKLKHSYDAANVCAPGRFVGGL